MSGNNEFNMMVKYLNEMENLRRNADECMINWGIMQIFIWNSSVIDGPAVIEVRLEKHDWVYIWYGPKLKEA